MKRYSRLERRHFPAIYLFLLPTLIQRGTCRKLDPSK